MSDSRNCIELAEIWVKEGQESSFLAHSATKRGGTSKKHIFTKGKVTPKRDNRNTQRREKKRRYTTRIGGGRWGMGEGFSEGKGKSACREKLG